ncbi:hypothetical protein MTBBW1_80032 [Desulfamplus magnetovallimortis]|uniref:Uncharacterized protein n=1 Tax=Desulfamplus magnetovallimortis TaxID=1246637 RepID=L0R3S7_9BACT|nr:hypothetical protein DEMABW1_80032 [Desulfamplus magnetovallimortis BW-1]SLM32694.1 hypothetical protein MTBBW1_80032 [Desulfamplus magnetovallimortis]
MMKIFIKISTYTDFHITYMADDRHNRRDESLYENSHLRGLSYKHTWQISATIEGMKVFMKTAICGDFHINPPCLLTHHN